MIKHFSTRQAAEADLKAHGFKMQAVGLWTQTGFKATCHPRQSGEVAVAYSEHKPVFFSVRDEMRSEARQLGLTAGE